MWGWVHCTHIATIQWNLCANLTRRSVASTLITTAAYQPGDTQADVGNGKDLFWCTSLLPSSVWRGIWGTFPNSPVLWSGCGMTLPSSPLIQNSNGGFKFTALEHTSGCGGSFHGRDAHRGWVKKNSIQSKTICLVFLLKVLECTHY